MKINRAGIDLIKHFEGCRVNAYQDPGGVWTIGYGHTGPDVFESKRITYVQADALLEEDLARFEEGISKCLGGAKTTENQFSAMVCLAYNIGLGHFKSSSVLRFHRDGNPNAAAQCFLLWNKAGGQVLAGLNARRKAESELYLKADE